VSKPDRVWPSSAPPRLRSAFGIGLKGFTGRDETDRRFATSWVIAWGLPLIPLRRYYLLEGPTYSDFYLGFHSTTSKEYYFYGESHLRAVEIIRTYIYCWLVVPAVVFVPTLALWSRADQFMDLFPRDSAIGPLVHIALFLGWLIGSTVALALLATAYRDRWAPVRDVEWVDRRDGG
jgi:hypothetical protein